MNDEQLDNFLDQRFAPLRRAPEGASLAPAIMQQVRDSDQQAVVPEATSGIGRDWILGFGWLIGGLICFNSFAQLDVFPVVSMPTWNETDPLAGLTTGLALAAMLFACAAPLWYVLIDD